MSLFAPLDLISHSYNPFLLLACFCHHFRCCCLLLNVCVCVYFSRWRETRFKARNWQQNLKKEMTATASSCAFCFLDIRSHFHSYSFHIANKALSMSIKFTTSQCSPSSTSQPLHLSSRFSMCVLRVEENSLFFCSFPQVHTKK
jgi:hypothetical protein